MNKIITMSLAAMLATLSISAQEKTYFVSPDGNDGSDGLSVESAWKTIDKVNTVVFQPGDKILFESGAVFKGQLKPLGSGSEGKPITISSFGGEKRPVIDFGEAEGAGILLENISYWEVKGMEITSKAPFKIGVGRQGISVTASGADHNLKHFVIQDNYIHDIWGQMGGRGENVGYYSSAILVRILRNRESFRDQSYKPSTINEVRIEGNKIERVDKCGIVCWGARDNVVVRKNYMDNIGGDGIFVNGPYRGLIEYNVIRRSCMRAGAPDLPGDDGWWPHVAACWIQDTEETIMQFNEVYDTGRNIYNGDGFAYDFDFNCKRCIAQYNYSKENNGFLLLMYNIFENVARYNISENDKTHLVQMQGSLKDDNNILYNNVFYVDHGLLDLDFFRGNEKETAKDINDLGAHFHNNIFYATGQGRFRTAYSTGETWKREFDDTIRPDLPSGSMFMSNCYFGPWKSGIPDDPKALVADPKFIAPGTGGDGLCSLAGYRLRPDSPCIGAGTYIPDNGRRDFFGQPVTDGKTDIGAFEYLGSIPESAPEKEAALDKAAREASSVAWARWSFPKVVATNGPSRFTIRLREPITDDIKGQISWTNPDNGKTYKLDISKLKDRRTIAIPVNANVSVPDGTKVKVSLTNGSFSEEFEIPVKEVELRNRWQ